MNPIQLQARLAPKWQKEVTRNLRKRNLRPQRTFLGLKGAACTRFCLVTTTLMLFIEGINVAVCQDICQTC